MPASRAKQAEVMDRRAKLVALRVAGVPFAQIAAQLGYKTASAAVQDLSRALAQRARELDSRSTDMRALEMERLEVMERRAWAVLRREHPLIQQGRTVTDTFSGEKIMDDGPVLAAIDRLLKIQERRSRLAGLDAPKSVEVITVDAVEAEIRRLTAELASIETDEVVGAEEASG